MTKLSELNPSWVSALDAKMGDSEVPTTSEAIETYLDGIKKEAMRNIARFAIVEDNKECLNAIFELFDYEYDEFSFNAKDLVDVAEEHLNLPNARAIIRQCLDRFPEEFDLSSKGDKKEKAEREWVVALPAPGF